MKLKIFKYIFVVFVITIIIIAIYLIGFKNKEENVNNETLSGDIVYKITDLRLGITEYDTMNPLLTKNKEIINIDKIIFEPLVKITEDYNIEMCLAKECSKVSDTSYIIKIDNNIKWQNGTALVTKDIWFTINVLKEGKSIYSSNVEYINDVQIIDESTVRINLSESVPFFEYNLTFPILSNDYYMQEDFYTTTKIPIGTGMFVISKIEDGNIVLETNDMWWKKEERNLETIHIKTYSSMGEIYNSFKLGNIDILNTSNLNLEDYIGTMGYTKQEIKGRQYDYLAFNVQDNILSKSEVRQAISYSIDKTQIISEVYNNFYYTADFPLDYGSYLYTADNVSSGYNPEQAKKILEDNGWIYKNNIWQKIENGKSKSLKIKLTVDSSNKQRVLVCENIKTQLEKVGIIVNIDKVSNNEYKSILKNKNYEMLLTGVYNSYNPNLEVFLGENNLQNYKNEDIIKILQEVRNIQDKDLLIEKYKQIVQIYNNEHPFIGLYRDKITIVKSQNLIGEVNPNNYFTYYNINKWYRF